MRHTPQWFRKASSQYLSHDTKQAYRNEIEHLSLEKFVHLTKICWFLMQTKTYLFWKKERNRA